MSARRPTRAELADHYRADWLVERADAETVDCPSCGSVIGVTCWNAAAGRPFDRSPAHPARITAAARTPALTPPPSQRPARPVAPRRSSAA